MTRIGVGGVGQPRSSRVIGRGKRGRGGQYDGGKKLIGHRGDTVYINTAGMGRGYFNLQWRKGLSDRVLLHVHVNVFDRFETGKNTELIKYSQIFLPKRAYRKPFQPKG